MRDILVNEMKDLKVSEGTFGNTVSVPNLVTKASVTVTPNPSVLSQMGDFVTSSQSSDQSQ